MEREPGDHGMDDDPRLMREPPTRINGCLIPTCGLNTMEDLCPIAFFRYPDDISWIATG